MLNDLPSLACWVLHKLPVIGEPSRANEPG